MDKDSVEVTISLTQELQRLNDKLEEVLDVLKDIRRTLNTRI